jgi:hypothetical protein
MSELETIVSKIKELKNCLTASKSVINDLKNNPNSQAVETAQRHAFRCITGPELSRWLLPSPTRGNHCPFLKAYREDSDAFKRDVIAPLIGNQPFNGRKIMAEHHSLIAQLREEVPNLGAKFLRGLELRLAMLLAFKDYKEGEDTKKAKFQDQLAALIVGYQKFFSTRVWTNSPNRSTSVKTAAMILIEEKNNALSGVIESAIQASQSSYLDPAVAFLIDSLAEVCGFEDKLTREIKTEEEQEGLARWRPGDTWVLTVVNLGDTKTGMVMRLRVELVCYEASPQKAQNSNRAVYPHPHLGAHFSISSDFQEGISNAWLTWHKIHFHSMPFGDFRWSLIPLADPEAHPGWWANQIAICTNKDLLDQWPKIIPESSRHLLLWVPLSGDSATLAFALALKSAHLMETLRRDRAATACFDADGKFKDKTTLGNVGGLPEKIEAALREGAMLLVSRTQKSELPLPDSKWEKVDNFEAAYERMREDERKLEDCADWFAGRWNRIVDAGKPKKTTR